MAKKSRSKFGKTCSHQTLSALNSGISTHTLPYGQEVDTLADAGHWH